MSKVEKYLRDVDLGIEEFSEAKLNRLYDEEEAYMNHFSEQRRRNKYRNGESMASMRPMMVW